jgi:hypothetical protein
MFSFTLLGALFIYVWTRPPRWTLIPVLIIAGCLRTLCIRLSGGVGDYYGVRWISWGAFLGIGALIVLAGEVVRVAWGRKEIVSPNLLFGSGLSHAGSGGWLFGPAQHMAPS